MDNKMDKFDFYTVQLSVDGFGNDTLVDSIWKTEEKAKKRAKKLKSKGFFCDVEGGFFGKELPLIFN